MAHFDFGSYLTMRNCVGPIIVSATFYFDFSVGAQTNSLWATSESSETGTLAKNGSSQLMVGPFHLHPGFNAGVAYDDNVLFAATNKEADAEWTLQPGLEAVVGDDDAWTAYRDENDITDLTPGNLIIQQPDVWPGKLLILNYAPRFQIFDRYSANDSVDQFANLKLFYPINKLILGVKQDYQREKTDIIQFNQRTTVESITTTLSLAYQLSDKSSFESDLTRASVGYDQTGLTGYTEYNTEDWFNYQVAENLPVSLGVLGGWDEVTGDQDEYYEQIRTRARYNYSEKITFDASVGAELRQYENGRSQTVTPVFNLSSEYRSTSRTILRLSGLRQQYASIYNGYNYESTGASLEIQQEMTDRFTVSANAGYFWIDYLPASLNVVRYSGDYFVVGTSLDIKIIRHLSGQIFYQHVGTHSEINPAVSDNQVGAKLMLRF